MVLALGGCAAPAHVQQLQAKQQEYFSWRQAAMERARSGQMKWSDFYVESYNRLAQLPDNDPGRLITMRGLADMTPVARAYEAGEMTNEQFGDIRRQAGARIQQEIAQARQLQAQQQEQARANQFSQTLQTMQLMQQSQPHFQPAPLDMSLPRQTNCYTSGNWTNCSTR